METRRYELHSMSPLRDYANMVAGLAQVAELGLFTSSGAFYYKELSNGQRQGIELSYEGEGNISVEVGSSRLIKNHCIIDWLLTSVGFREVSDEPARVEDRPSI